MSKNTDFIVKMINARALIEEHDTTDLARFGITILPEWTERDLAHAILALEDLNAATTMRIRQLKNQQKKAA